MANSWRTIFPQYQEEVLKVSTKRTVVNATMKNNRSVIFANQGAETMTPRKRLNINATSQENPLSNSMYLPKEEKPKKCEKKNKLSAENPLNYKLKITQSERKINSKVTASKVVCLPGSIKVPSPPRVVKFYNSETYLDFLPGALYTKPYPDETSRKKLLGDPKQSTDFSTAKTSCKRLKQNKMRNNFSINNQYED